MKKRVVSLLLSALLCASLTGCSNAKPEEVSLFAMDTYMTITAIGDGAADVLTRISQTVNALEASLSRTVAASEVSQLNRDGCAVWDGDGAQLLSWALRHSEETGGAFDVTIAPLVELWGITSDSPRVPAQAEIDALLPLVGDTPDTPPVNAPRIPVSFTPSIAPRASAYPKPSSGTVAPAPAKSTIGLYSPSAPRITPAVT